MEAFILTLDVFAVTYLCWRLFRHDPKEPESQALGFMGYRTDGEE
jgi:hypothetical protein